MSPSSLKFRGPVSITGVGVVAPTGVGAEHLWLEVHNDKSHIHQDSFGRLVGRVSSDELSDLSNQILQSKSWNLVQDRYPGLPLGPSHLMALGAMNEAMKQAGWAKLNSDDGLILATTTGLVTNWETALANFSSTEEKDYKYLAEPMRYQSLGCILEHLAISQGFSGQKILVTSACAAATQALALAYEWLQSGKVKRCLVGGVEVLSQLTLRGFESFQLLSDEVARPFDRDRNGINLSEGAGFLCLERKPNADVLAELCGGGIASDGYHMTAPDPQGSGCRSSILKALQHAAIRPAEVDWIHAHGTGSIHNDISESRAIQAVFPGLDVPVSSTKAIHGHMLAASGAVESILCVMSFTKETMLGTANYTTSDPDISLVVNRRSEPRTMNHILKTTLGFGGANGAVVFSRKGKGTRYV